MSTLDPEETSAKRIKVGHTYDDTNDDMCVEEKNVEIDDTYIYEWAKKSARKEKNKLPIECPYLGTINRHMLDFDFEKLCSISLSNQHVYCCLVCGKFFQGRGKGTYAYMHSLEEGHYVFINLHDCKIYCLPENYLVEDASLDDVRLYLNPRYSKEEVENIDKLLNYGKALDGTDFIPGLVGLNNLKKTDYFNVIIQMLCVVSPMRSHMLLLDLSNSQRPDPVLQTFSDLMKKIYNTRNFKGIVSPHEFLQAVGVASEKQFKIGQQKDPLSLLTWLLDRLHKKIKVKSTQSSVVKSCFEGSIIIQSSNVVGDEEINIRTHEQTCMMLTLELPPAPIFKDSLDRNMIPHVPIFDLLQKFDGETIHESVQGLRKRYSLWRLPKFMIFHVKRFSKNNYFVEKNPTIVNLTVKNLDLKDYIHPDAVDDNACTKYNLVANICHDGKPQDGTYRMHVLHAPSNEWYELVDLRVTPVLPQLVAISESYIQLYKRQDV